MPDEGKGPPNPEPAVSRRQFFSKLGLGTLVAAVCGTALFAYKYLSSDASDKSPPIVNAGRLGRYPPDSVTLDRKAGIYLVHTPQGFYSLSAICTHRKCLTGWRPDLGIIVCPCHGSKFRRDGSMIEGPAPRPLPWLKTWLSTEGDLMVDRSVVLSARQLVRL
jgi:nitrite reductase/ring-hydroxylating ferredoxin subunit